MPRGRAHLIGYKGRGVFVRLQMYAIYSFSTSHVHNKPLISKGNMQIKKLLTIIKG